MDKQIHALSAANQRIQELLDLVEVVERHNKQLEERIRVADAEEPVARVTHTLLGFNVSYLKTLRGVTTLYAHAQIPAEVDLKAKIAGLKAIINESQPAYRRMKWKKKNWMRFIRWLSFREYLTVRRNEMFAKIFDSSIFGQILVKRDVSEDSKPEVRFYFEPPELGVCSLAIGFADNDTGWDLCDAAFDAATLEKAEDVLKKGIPKELIDFS